MAGLFNDPTELSGALSGEYHAENIETEIDAFYSWVLSVSIAGPNYINLTARRQQTQAREKRPPRARSNRCKTPDGRFTEETGIKLEITYGGPVDIRNAVSSLSEDIPKTVDAYWPVSSLWLPGSSGVEPVSVMKTYVVLAFDPESAREHGWDIDQVWSLLIVP